MKSIGFMDQGELAASDSLPANSSTNLKFAASYAATLASFVHHAKSAAAYGGALISYTPMKWPMNFVNLRRHTQHTVPASKEGKEKAARRAHSHTHQSANGVPAKPTSCTAKPIKRIHARQSCSLNRLPTLCGSRRALCQAYR